MTNKTLVLSIFTGLGLSDDDRQRIRGELNHGTAAVGVLTPTSEAAGVSNTLTRSGGECEELVAAEEELRDETQ